MTPFTPKKWSTSKRRRFFSEKKTALTIDNQNVKNHQQINGVSWFPAGPPFLRESETAIEFKCPDSFLDKHSTPVSFFLNRYLVGNIVFGRHPTHQMGTLDLLESPRCVWPTPRWSHNREKGQCGSRRYV